MNTNQMFSWASAYLAVGVLRDPTVNTALGNLCGNKGSEEEEKDEATHSQKGKVHSEWEKGRREIVEACLL